MKAKRRYLSNFETRSVMLMAACAFGATGAAYAQTPDASAQRAPTQVIAQATAPAAPAAPAAATPAPKAAMADKDIAAAFVKADKNKDGKLSREECDALPAVAQRFEQIDADGDKFLSRDEFDKAMKM